MKLYAIVYYSWNNLTRIELAEPIFILTSRTHCADYRIRLAKLCPIDCKP